MFGSAGSVERLANWLARLPGIGRKTAARLAFHILKLPNEEALELAGEQPETGLIVLHRRRTRQAECGHLLRLLAQAGVTGLASNINFA